MKPKNFPGRKYERRLAALERLQRGKPRLYGNVSPTGAESKEVAVLQKRTAASYTGARSVRS